MDESDNGLEGVIEHSGLNTGLLLKAGDFKLAASVVEREYFATEWFSKAELYIIRNLDQRIVQPTMKAAGVRKYSGLPAYTHIDRVLEIAFSIAKKTKQKKKPGLDFETVIAILGHDIIEEDQGVRNLLNDLRHATTEDELSLIRGNLQAAREIIKEDLTDDMHEFVSKTGLTEREKKALNWEVDTGVRIIYQITRYPEKKSYADSMKWQMTRKGNEPLERTLRRMVVKCSDRISNLREVGQLYSDEVMARAKQQFEDPESGAQLRERFGSMQYKGAEMPLALQVVNGFNSVFVLNYINRTLNNYAAKIKRGGQKANLPKLAMASRDEVIRATLELFDSVIEKYGRVITAEDKQKVEEEIAQCRTDKFYEKVDEDGPLMKWMHYDIGKKETIMELDVSYEGRLEVYKAARHFRELVQRYTAPHDNSPKKHKPELFTLGGLDEAVKGFKPEVYSAHRSNIPSGNANH